MLPCQSQCPAYQPGCHKACARWRLLQEKQRTEREAKKQYLQYHSLRCAEMTRQYLSLQVRYPAW